MTPKGAAGRQPRKPAAPDVVYVIRPGDVNEELRYSLRSVAKHTPHRHVWIVGTVPSWVTNVKTLPLPPQPEKFANQRQSLTAACGARGVSDPFVLFNDDMFVVEPITEWRTWNIDTIEDHWGGPIGYVDPHPNEWLHAVWQTYKWMQDQGHPDPLYYENHTPLLYDKASLSAVLAEYPTDRPFAVNGTYAITGAGGEGDCGGNAKLSYDGPPELVPDPVAMGMPYLSTDDSSFLEGPLGVYLRGLFPDPGPYERRDQ